MKRQRCCLHRIVWNTAENIISIFVCRMTVKGLRFPTARKDPLKIRCSFPAAGSIRLYSSTMTGRLTITGGSYFPTVSN